MSALWWAILLTAVGCYALKLVGMCVPERVLENPPTKRAAGLIPVGLLGALIAVQVFGSDQSIAFDARLAGVGVAGLLLLARAPFLVVVFGAALLTAGLRLI